MSDLADFDADTIDAQVNGGKSSFPTISSAEQSRRDAIRLSMLNNEMSNTVDPQAKSNLQAEINSTNKSSPLAGFDADTIHAEVSAMNKPASKATQSVNGETVYKPEDFDFDSSTASTILTGLSSIGSNIIGGYKGMWAGVSKLAKGGSASDAQQAAEDAVAQEKQQGTYQPAQGSVAAKIQDAFNSKYNPLTLIGRAGKYVGNAATDSAATSQYPAIKSAAPALGTIADTLTNLAPTLLAPEIRAGSGRLIAPINPISIARKDAALIPDNKISTDQVAGEKQNLTQDIDHSISAGNSTTSALPSSVQQSRSNILSRIGIQPENQRVSAIEGNAVNANDEMQAAKSNESSSPNGPYIKQKLDSERAAITSHGEDIVRSTGGTIGTDEATLNTKGQTMSAPFDALKDYFKNATSSLKIVNSEQV